MHIHDAVRVRALGWLHAAVEYNNLISETLI